jgi:hypothetical protein
MEPMGRPAELPGGFCTLWPSFFTQTKAFRKIFVTFL